MRIKIFLPTRVVSLPKGQQRFAHVCAIGSQRLFALQGLYLKNNISLLCSLEFLAERQIHPDFLSFLPCYLGIA